MAQVKFSEMILYDGLRVDEDCQIGLGDTPVAVNKGDILYVVGFSYDKGEGAGSVRCRMSVVVFSGETREQIGDCLVDLDTAVSGARLYETADDDTDVRRRGERAMRDGGGKYTYREATSKEMGRNPREDNGHVHDHQLPTPEEMEKRRRRREEATVARAREDAWNLGRSQPPEVGASEPVPSSAKDGWFTRTVGQVKGFFSGG